MDMADEDITETLIKVHVLTSRPWKIEVGLKCHHRLGDGGS